MKITKSGDRKLIKSTDENVITHLNENDEGFPYKWNQNRGAKLNILFLVLFVIMAHSKN